MAKKPASKKRVKRRAKAMKKNIKKPVNRKKKVLAIPKGYHSITPYLIVNNAANAIDFYKKIFGAKEVMRMQQPGGKVAHAELKVGDAKFMLADEHPEMNAHSPQAYGGSPVSIHLYVKDVDTIFARAISAGAKLIRPVDNMFYGDRCGTLEDPYGHKWHVSTHIEDVTPAKMKKRMMEFMNK